MEWQAVWKAFREFGQFPGGILVGILIHRWVAKRLLEHAEKSLEMARKEKEELAKLFWGLTAKQKQEEEK